MEDNKKIGKTTNEDISNVLSLMDKIQLFIKKNGLKGTFTSLLTLFIASVMTFFIFNPNVLFDRFQSYADKKHEKGIKQRLEVSPIIRSQLIQFRAELGADRVYILEAHNGGTNLTHLPFLYADLTYIEPKASYAYIEAEYKNFSLSRYPWSSYVIEHGCWFGSIEDCRENDPELYYRLDKEGVVYMGMYVMYYKTGLPSACLGIVYVEGQNIPETRKIHTVMQKYANIINTYLTTD